MTRRIFDVENEKDMQDLWDILPDKIVRILLEQINCFPEPRTMVEYLNTQKDFFTSLIAINWHDKTEITRPIQECTEQDIGKLCYFWSADNPNDKAYGILSSIGTENGEKYYTIDDACFYEHCRRLTKQEIEELC